MMCLFVPAFYFVLGKWHDIWRFTCFVFAGAAIIIAPFVVAFLAMGNFGAFVNEYFINTLQTAKHLPDSDAISQIQLVLRTVTSSAVLGLIFGICSIPLLSKVKSPRKYIIAIICLLFFFALLPRGDYYESLLSVFAVYFIVWLLENVFKWDWSPKLTFFIGGASLFYLLLCYTQSSGVRIYSTPSGMESLETEMATMRRPKVLYYNMLDYGIGLPSQPLPATRYWIAQNGRTNQMIESIQNAAIKGDADVVFAMREFDLGADSTFIKSQGYQKKATGQHFDLTIDMYVKHK